jgi:putative glycosyltransferase (TIGR04372 family)
LPFLSLFDQQCVILDPVGRLGEKLAAELYSLQRYCGFSFNAFEIPDGQIVPWQEAGAIMIRQWEAEGRGYPMRDRFDRKIGSNSLLREGVDRIKRQWGMQPNDWYVCLHLRDASHYGEVEGLGQTHRNARVATYTDAIRHVTQQGGWVIKLGGPASPKLPPMKRVVDYSRGPFKSSMLDLDLVRNARYFVGTTSGLTNVAVSFGVPCALVNCITTDAQLWGNRVRFALKPVKKRDGAFTTQRQLTSTPWRWRVFSAEIMWRYGAEPIDNTSDEVLETVKEVEALAVGGACRAGKIVPETARLIDRWQQSLTKPYFYGNALPSIYYLRKHENQFLA